MWNLVGSCRVCKFVAMVFILFLNFYYLGFCFVGLDILFFGVEYVYGILEYVDILVFKIIV